MLQHKIDNILRDISLEQEFLRYAARIYEPSAAISLINQKLHCRTNDGTLVVPCL